MPVHIMQPGETVVSLSEANGLFARTIWEHPENEDLRAKRSRMDVLAPGDPLFLPERQDGSAAIATDRRHRFRRKGIPAKIRVQFRLNGQPRKNQKYTLQVAGLNLNGVTGEDGVVQQFVPASAKEAMLVFEGDNPMTIRLRLGGMEPDNTLAGVRKRLANLGIPQPTGDDPASGEWRLALLRFQRRLGLQPTGKLDDATSAALLKDHDRVSIESQVAHG